MVSNDVTKIVITMTGPIVGLITSTGSLIVLKVYLKDLHVVMKNLLEALSIHSVIASISTIAIEGYINYTNDISLEICTIATQCIGPSFYITFEMFSFMSFVRYYLASKTQALEAPKEWMLYLIAGIIYVSEHVYIPIAHVLAVYFDFPSGATECAGECIRYRFFENRTNS